MQLAGTQLTNTSALVGNDVATFPDFPAEIRAPRGTKAGGFQLTPANTWEKHLATALEVYASWRHGEGDDVTSGRWHGRPTYRQPDRGAYGCSTQ